MKNDEDKIYMLETDNISNLLKLYLMPINIIEADEIANIRENTKGEDSEFPKTNNATNT